MGCDMYNTKNSKIMHLIVTDYKTGNQLKNIDIDIEGVSEIQYEFYDDADGIRGR